MNALHSKPWSFLRGGRRKRTPSKAHQGRKEMQLMRAWKLLLKHVNAKTKRCFFTSKKKKQETAEAETIFNGTIKDTLSKNRRARETRQDREHEGGGLGDHGGGLLQGAHRTPRRSTEAPERARCTAEPAKHRHPFHAVKTAQRRKKKQAHAWSTKFVVFSCIMSESEEVWFDVRPKAVGKNRSCPIDELCSESSESSRALDAMTAKWYDAFETRAAACASSSWRLSSDWSGDSSGGPTYKKEIHRPP